MQQATKVLVVDDDRPIVDLITEVLRDEGYSVRSAFDAVSALAAIEVETPDLVLLDLLMPGPSGAELFRILVERDLATVPVILMTADNHAVEALVAEGVKFILVKPFDLDTLLDCVQGALNAPQEIQDQGSGQLVQGDLSEVPQDVYICT
jgi:two-component system, NtrC family, nitrogen regulation response regulator NtrX